MDEISGSSLEASVAALGWKAGTLPGLSNLEVLYIKHVLNTKITLFYGHSHLHAAFLYFPEPRGDRQNASFLQDNNFFFQSILLKYA